MRIAPDAQALLAGDGGEAERRLSSLCEAYGWRWSVTSDRARVGHGERRLFWHAQVTDELGDVLADLRIYPPAPLPDGRARAVERLCRTVARRRPAPVG